jgi:hypothetical protein
MCRARLGRVRMRWRGERAVVRELIVGHHELSDPELAAATGLRFRSGRGSCVRDAYTTTTSAQFIEIACLVRGPRVASVIVGAAPPQTWTRMSPLIERAISALTT